MWSTSFCIISYGIIPQNIAFTSHILCASVCVFLAPQPAVYLYKFACACTCAHSGVPCVGEADVVLYTVDAAFSLYNEYDD